MCHTKTYTLYVTILHIFLSENSTKLKNKHIFDELQFFEIEIISQIGSEAFTCKEIK